jgi:pyruvate dehydrogenase E2 component (dihydrolipoamide acetyltransferase)
MPTPVVMPQMGESVAEGTIVRWLKKVGEPVERDEPLFEISTDKVDAEIPSPIAGVLNEIRVAEGDTVPVNSVVAFIGEAGEAVATAPAAARPASPPVVSAKAPARVSADRDAEKPEGTVLAAPWSAAESRELRLSPVVRRIAKDHHVDVRNIAGSGANGRVTKADILGYVEAGQPASAPSSQIAAAGQAPAPPDDPAKVDRVPMTVLRRAIAEHMVASRRTSAHVHSVFEVDFTRVDEMRAASKLTYLAFITRAVAAALKAVPVLNSSVNGNDIVFKKEINIGVAVALDGGLIVPVVKHADRKSLQDIGSEIADLAARARARKLKPSDVQDGTFTISNPGVYSTLFGMPIINQPQVAILAVGVIEKRAVVVDDAIVIRRRAYLTLGYDHRIIDGAVADEFMVHVRRMIENPQA